ncbi:unnamed protein product [Linum trigynum]|uniref:Serine/arginine repetitive matrix protein 1-like n=1 Tax=Linum trigynum TaxID=586398 RepID=A0AAV2FIQ8_9ROSI
MGCCLSSASKSSPPVSATHPSSKNGNRYDFEPPKFLKSTAETRAPPPDCDEETVKEVLSSETPNPKPPHRPPPPQQQHYSAIPPPQSPPNPVNPEPEEPILLEKKEIRAPVVEKLVEEEEISEQDASEVCSVSVSFSMSESAMSTATTANDEEVTMKQMKGSRRSSPSGKMSAARINRAFSTADSRKEQQRVVGRSPTRRSDRSPVKRNYSGGGGAGQQVRMVHHQGPNPGARRPLRPDPSRRETGDSSAARRSRSPATTHRSAGAAGTGAGSRNGSVKRANQSPGRVRKDPPEISANSEATKSGNGDTAFHHHRGNDDDDEKEDAAAANESLENPLVSLECFIFL